MRHFTIGLCAAIQFFCVVPSALAKDQAKQEPLDNPQLASLFKGDQDDRRGEPSAPPDWTSLQARDATRHAQLMELLQRGSIRTANDHARAAMLLQHGDPAESIRLAHAMATIAYAMAPANKDARWLMAASWDRLMVRLDRPQWFGTQFNRIGDTGPWTMDPIDDRVTDAERATYFVLPLAEMRKRLAELNAAEPPK